MRSRGVTLLELLLVLGIMAIVFAVALPHVNGGVSGTELKSAARKVAAGLREARITAVSQHTDAVLEIDLDQHTFRVSGDSREYTLPAKTDLKLFTAQQEIVTDRVGSIRFYPDGGSTGGRITVAAGERKYDIDVNWLTGRVDISQ